MIVLSLHQTMSSRLRKALIAFLAPSMERVICGCGMWFWRPIVPHPETFCDGCRDEHMEAWLSNYEARQAVNGQSVRRIG